MLDLFSSLPSNPIVSKKGLLKKNKILKGPKLSDSCDTKGLGAYYVGGPADSSSWTQIPPLSLPFVLTY